MQAHLMRRLFRAGAWHLAITVLVLSLTMGATPVMAGPPNGNGTHADLLKLFGEYQAWKAPPARAGVTDHGLAAIEARRAQIRAMQNRMDKMGVARWFVPQQVDFLTTRAELDQQEFILNVTRPWARDPVFYLSPLLPTAFTTLPASGDDLAALQQKLRAVPKVLDGARSNLTDVAADYADLAIRSLTQSDGVEDDYPSRSKMPAGIIGWYEDLLARTKAQPALKSDVTIALKALREFHQWLIDNRGKMNARTGVGKEALDWFIKYGLLLPYTSDQMEVLSQREIERFWAFYALEKHRNRDLPEIKISGSEKEYLQRLGDTDKLVRDFLVKDEFITIPEFIPKDWRVMGYGVPFAVRATPPNFWEQVQYRDPAPDHLHAVIPGHRFDDMVSSRINHPIRSKVNFGARWQGWAVYLEEGPLQLGIFDARPRTRELIYVFGLWRAARAIGDIYNQWNKFNAAETAKYWLSVTPYLDPNVARKYAYLRPLPGHGLEYTIGNIQMFRLLAERKQQLGDKFVLREFHDDFISKGRIPIAAVQYEMTGDASAVAQFWDRTPMPSLQKAAAPAPK